MPEPGIGGTAGFTLGDIFGGAEAGGPVGSAAISDLIRQLGPAVGGGILIPQLGKMATEIKGLVIDFQRLRRISKTYGKDLKDATDRATEALKQYVVKLQEKGISIAAIQERIEEARKDPTKVTGRLGQLAITAERLDKALKARTMYEQRLQKSLGKLGDAVAMVTGAFAGMAIGKIDPLSKQLAELRHTTLRYNMTLREQIVFRGRMGAEFGMAGLATTDKLTMAFAEATRKNLATMPGGRGAVAMAAMPGEFGQAFTQNWETLYRSMFLGRKNVNELTDMFVLMTVQADEAGVSTSEWTSVVTRTAERFRDLGLDMGSTAVQFDLFTEVMDDMGITTQEVANVIAQSVSKLGGLDVQNRMKTVSLLRMSFDNLPATAQKSMDMLAKSMFGVRFRQLTGVQMDMWGQEAARRGMGGMMNAILLQAMPGMTQRDPYGRLVPTMAGATFARTQLGVRGMVEWEALTRQLEKLSGATREDEAMIIKSMISTGEHIAKTGEVSEKTDNVINAFKELITPMNRFRGGLDQATERLAALGLGTPFAGAPSLAVGAGGLLARGGLDILSKGILLGALRGGGVGTGLKALASAVPGVSPVLAGGGLATPLLGVAVPALVATMGIAISGLIESKLEPVTRGDPKRRAAEALLLSTLPAASVFRGIRAWRETEGVEGFRERAGAMRQFIAGRSSEDEKIAALKANTKALKESTEKGTTLTVEGGDKATELLEGIERTAKFKNIVSDWGTPYYHVGGPGGAI